MGRLVLAFRAFFRVLFDAACAAEVRRALLGERVVPAASPTEAKPAQAPMKPRSKRSEALSLLAALQREARLVDFIQEPIAAYSDAQVGAAVRDVHRQCQSVLDRFFAPKAVVEGQEGSQVAVPEGSDAASYKLVGNVTGQPPFRGKLCHHGWQATRCELPEWTGNEASALLIAPAEVELA